MTSYQLALFGSFLRFGCSSSCSFAAIRGATADSEQPGERWIAKVAVAPVVGRIPPVKKKTNRQPSFHSSKAEAHHASCTICIRSTRSINKSLPDALMHVLIRFWLRFSLLRARAPLEHRPYSFCTSHSLHGSTYPTVPPLLCTLLPSLRHESGPERARSRLS